MTPEFRAWPKIPRLNEPMHCIITEKLDGTSTQIVIRGGEIVAVGSRNRYTTSRKEKEKYILELVLNQKTNDIYPLLAPDCAEKLRQYEDDLNSEMGLLAATLQAIVSGAQMFGMSRKTFALEIVSQADKKLQGAYFEILDGRNSLDVVKESVYKHPELLTTRW